MSDWYRFEPCGPDRWTIEAYDYHPEYGPPTTIRVGGSPGWFSLPLAVVYTDHFKGAEDDHLSPQQRAWFLHVFEGGPRPVQEGVA